MSKTNDISKLGPATLEDHRPLADSELDAVSGGWLPSGKHRIRLRNDKRKKDSKTMTSVIKTDATRVLNDTERTRELTEAELDAVSGGFDSYEHTTITTPAETTLWGWRKMIVDGALKEPVY